MKRHIISAGIAMALLAGCSINVKHSADNENGGQKDKEVTIKSPLGGLHVRTDQVDPKDTGMAVYPGARLKEKDNGDDNKANVNIDTPWFGVKVVALTYVTDDPQEKVWDFYKKELSKYGKVLECKPGSPDMNIVSHDKTELTCRDRGAHNNDGRLNINPDEPHLKVGTEQRQRVVGFKHAANGTQFSLVYVVTHGGDDKDKI